MAVEKVARCLPLAAKDAYSFFDEVLDRYDQELKRLWVLGTCFAQYGADFSLPRVGERIQLNSAFGGLIAAILEDNNVGSKSFEIPLNKHVQALMRDPALLAKIVGGVVRIGGGEI